MLAWTCPLASCEFSGALQQLSPDRDEAGWLEVNSAFNTILADRMPALMPTNSNNVTEGTKNKNIHNMCPINWLRQSTPHHNRFTALFPRPPGWAGARREPLDFMVQGKIKRQTHWPSGWAPLHPDYAVPTSIIPHVLYRPDALPAAQPTVSKHWRQILHDDYANEDKIYVHSWWRYNGRRTGAWIKQLTAVVHEPVFIQCSQLYIRIRAVTNPPQLLKPLFEIQHRRKILMCQSYSTHKKIMYNLHSYQENFTPN